MKQQTIAAARALLAARTTAQESDQAAFMAKQRFIQSEANYLETLRHEGPPESPSDPTIAIDGTVISPKEEFWDCKPGERISFIPIVEALPTPEWLTVMQLVADCPMSTETPGVAMDEAADEIIGRARALVGRTS